MTSTYLPGIGTMHDDGLGRRWLTPKRPPLEAAFGNGSLAYLRALDLERLGARWIEWRSGRGWSLVDTPETGDGKIKVHACIWNENVATGVAPRVWGEIDGACIGKTASASGTTSIRLHSRFAIQERECAHANEPLASVDRFKVARYVYAALPFAVVAAVALYYLVVHL